MKIEDIDKHIASTKDFLVRELSQIRTGRVVSSLVEDIEVKAYENSEPLTIKELASVTIVDSQSLLITPWDKSILGKIEDAIRNSGKGLNPANEGEDIRITIPALTEERRKQLVKEISAKVEEAKIAIRNIRQNAIKAIDEQEENGVISEDEMHRQKKIVEEKISEANESVIEMGKRKREEVMKI